MKSKKTSTKNRGGAWALYVPSALKPIGFSLLFGIVVFAVILMLFALVMSFRDVPAMLFGPMSVAALIAGCMVSGFAIGRFMRTAGMAYGACCGAVLYALIFLASLCMGEPIGLSALFKLIIALLSGAIGGIVGVNMRVRRRK